MKQLSQQEADQLVKKLENVWDIENHYWYPLYDCKRDDVIAFHYRYVEGIEWKVEAIKQFLFSQNRNQLLEMDEDRTLRVIESDTFSLYADGHTTEKFWFDHAFDWIIYTSHEGSIAFGGKELITALKEKWPDWASNLFP